MSPLESLASRAGAWVGTNTLQDPHTGRPEESASNLTITPVLGGRFVRLDYDWLYQGKPQEGSLLIGHDPKSAVASGHWIDTWHMGRLVLNCRGDSPDGESIAVRGSYAAPPGPDWGWRIEVAWGEGGVKIRHTNVEPDGEESLAVEGVYAIA